MIDHHRAMWQANYKSMSSSQLMTELKRMAESPHRYDNLNARKAFIADELMIKTRQWVDS